MSSLSRAFTTKRAKKPSDVDLTISLPQRSATTKQSFSSGTIRQKKISAPIELISTTNMLSYNAPDIYPRSRSNTISSSNSDGRSVFSNSATSPSSVGTPFTSPDSSSRESSPTTSSPEPNHLSCYFGQNVVSDDEAPKIPTRALSHTKQSAEMLARKKSMTRMSPKNSISSRRSKSTMTSRSSINMFSPNPEAAPEHPFGNELAQVSELVEEYERVEVAEPVPEPIPVFPTDPEEQELVSKGLFKFSAEDYMSELQGLFAKAFGDAPQAIMPPVWI